jgi:type VI secretion system protein ImpC
MNVQTAQTTVAQELETAAQSPLLELINKSRVATNDDEKVYARDLVGEMAKQVLEGEIVVSKDLVASIDARIAALDELISAQLNEIMHQPDFQSLEGSWRGLNHLIMESETSTMLKIKLFNISRRDLIKDFRKAPEFDQGVLFKKVYEEEFGTFGGSPFTTLICDYAFGRHPEDFYLMEQLAHVGAAALAPVIAAASPALFGLESYTEIVNLRDISKTFDTTEYAMWKSFRDSDDSRYFVLTMPRALGRLPYGAKTLPVEEFGFEEDTDGTDHNKYLWTNAAFSLGTRISDACSKYGWPAAIRGPEGGGRVEGLPAHNFLTDQGDLALKCPAEVQITDRMEKQLSDLGIISLVHCKDTDFAAFFSGATTQKPKRYDKDEANANARLSAQLPYILTASRIGHYMKAIMRDKIGSFVSRQDVENYLNKWLAQYVSLDDTAPQETKAKLPLRQAEVTVVEVPGEPGVYLSVLFLRPHFQLEGLTMSLRLVAQLPKPAK